MTVVDSSTRETRMMIAPIAHRRCQSFEAEAPFVKSAYGLASMDAAAFIHSPDHKDVRRVTHCELTFTHVAIPMDVVATVAAGRPMRVTVNKAHVLGFEAGRNSA